MSDTIKAQSFALANALKKLGIKLSHGQALDVMAQVHGAMSWNHALAAQHLPDADDKLAETAPTARALSTEERRLVEHVVADQDRWWRYLSEAQTLRVLVAGNLDGTYREQAVIKGADQQMTQAKLNLLIREKTDEPGLYLAVTLAGGQRQPTRAIEVVPLTHEEMASATFEVELRAYAAARRVQCPLLGRIYHPLGEGVQIPRRIPAAFVAGEDFPLHARLVPARLMKIAGELIKGQNAAKVKLTVGEAVASYRQREPRIH
jgi:hypothetical protein